MKPQRLGILAATAILAFLALRAATPAEDALQRHRNLGKAFYENPTTHAEAIAELKKALDLAPNSLPEKLNYALALLRGGRAPEAVTLLQDVQRRDPALPHTWFNLGIFYKQNNELDKATAQFEQLIKLAPDEPIAHYQLGTLFRAEGNPERAAAEFQRTAQLNPLLAAAHFQLYNLYRTSGRQPDAARELATFQQLKKDAEGAALPEDVDWCNFAELYDPPRQPASPTAALPAGFDDKTLGPAAGMLAIDSTGTGQTDLLVWSDTGIQLYRRGTELVADTGLGNLKSVLSVAAGDFDNDGFMDVCILTETGPLLYRNVKGRFQPAAASLPARRFETAVWIDYDHDYDLDLVLLGDTPALLRNQGAAGFADRTADFPFASGHPTSAFKLRAVPDTKAFDLAVLYAGRDPVLYRDQLGGHYTATPFPGPPPSPEIIADFRARIVDGKAHVLLPRRRPNSHWIRVQLAGVKSLKLAQDAEVEIKAGSLYLKRMYEGFPLSFDLGANTVVDAVRITWPNGLIQNETNQAANKSYRYEEAQRLSGSCPMIWTWNGREFEFVTDVLGVAPLGASDGEGTYFPVDHDEYVQIPAAALKPRDGQYEIRITEELSEVSYLDQVQLIAVDHRANAEIFTNEKFKSPPYPEFRLYSAARRVYPSSALLTGVRDSATDVLPALLARDHRYPSDFPRTQLGTAPLHTLELSFPGTPGDAVLLLNGWVDWPDGSTFRAASQERPGGLTLPYLQMQDTAGRWVTVNADMGMPAGKPKTIAVPLHWLSGSRKLRITTDLCVYWDEIFLSESTAPPEARLHTLSALAGDLHFRGFSASRIDPARQQPDTFFYSPVMPTSFWNPTPGFYTRYGDVRPLLHTVDDRFVIMGSGDEVTLRFDVPPPPPPGWSRDFLLKVDGWAKDRDPNTAWSTTVGPLPFHAMSRYPYPSDEHHPDAAYQTEYNTRPALRLTRPLTR
jgi:tetratricopeptide (TPR) repeat protein